MFYEEQQIIVWFYYSFIAFDNFSGFSFNTKFCIEKILVSFNFFKYKCNPTNNKQNKILGMLVWLVQEPQYIRTKYCIWLMEITFKVFSKKTFPFCYYPVYAIFYLIIFIAFKKKM